MTDKDNSQTGEYSYTYSYSYSKEGGEKNVEVHTGGFAAGAIFTRSSSASLAIL